MKSGPVEGQTPSEPRNALARRWQRVLLVAVILGAIWHPALAQPNGTVAQQDTDRITLNVADTKITDVLKMLARQRRVNIVAGDEVSGKVSINLYDVSFQTALGAILRVKGFTSYQQENVIFVTKAAKKPEGLVGPLRTSVRTFRLNFANIEEATDMVRSLLSPGGKVVMGKAHKTLMIEDNTETLDKIASLLKALDVPPRQVLIEAKILEVTLNNDTDVGVDWTAFFGGPSAFVERLGRSFSQGFAADPATGAPGMFFSVVHDDVSVLLSALEERGNVNTIASPKIMAVDGQEAQILIGAKLGFRITTTTQTSTLESVEFLDVGTELVILPTIGNDGQILMEVHPKVSDGRVEDGLPNETTTEATTSVVVQDGVTVLIGGLIRERDEVSTRAVPGLGRLPLIGSLFRGRTTNKLKTEIVVFITPHIVPHTPPDAPAKVARIAQPARPIWDTDFVMALSQSLP